MMILKVFVLGCWGHQFVAAGAGPDLETTKEEGSSQCMLAKRKTRTLRTGRTEETEVLEYKSRGASPAMKYFKDWSKRLVGSLRLKPKEGRSTPMLVEEKGDLQKTLMDALVKQKGCSRKLLEEQRWSLIEHEESDNVDHFIFKKIGTQSKVQYIATHMNRIIDADPPMDCASELQSERAEDPEIEREREKEVKGGGAKTLLHPQNDEMVKDCKKLYERTVDDICKKKILVTVLRANREIIDGIEVDMEVEVVGAAGKTTRHAPSCLFELFPNDKDASLLQNLEDPAERDPTEAEKKGMTATLRASSDLCKADEEDGQNVFLETRPSIGYLGFYRGYEYVDAQLPRAKFAARDDLPLDVDLRKKYPKCFLQGGLEVIRNQGECGSCWAFAASSALMNNLCTSKEDSPINFADATDRYEVSVQQVLSCNAGKQGCDGAWASTANQAFLDHGISRERDHPYQCGSGNPLNHFEGSNSCKKWPWGGKCTKDNVADWIYGGALNVAGEQDMLTLLSQGHALYVTMKIDDSFMWEDWSSKIYDGTNQYGKKGGHAMTGIGYGVQDNVKYWLVQNSWGGEWGDKGVIKIKRGVNLDGIDEGAFYFRGWVKGASEPQVKCTDKASWCFVIKKEQCTDFHKVNCAVTCDACGGSAAVPQPTPAPTPCSDQASWCYIVTKEECTKNFYKTTCPVTCDVCG